MTQFPDVRKSQFNIFLAVVCVILQPYVVFVGSYCF